MTMIFMCWAPAKPRSHDVSRGDRCRFLVAALPRCRERWAHLRQLSDRAVSYKRVAQRKDGSLISLEVVASYSEAGGVGHVFTYFRDVEERLQVEATLREARVEHERAQRIGHLGHWRR